MYHSQIKLRVRYGETDRMGFVYYGNYAEYFEVARVEALRELGINYKDLEDSGIMLPVLDYSVKFIKPAYYDDELLIKTTIPELPKARIKFEFETFIGETTLITKAQAVLVFVDRQSNKPCQAPDFLLVRMSDYFS